MFKNYLRLLIPRIIRSLIVASLTLLITQPVPIQGFNAPNTIIAAPGFQKSDRFVSTPIPQIPRAYFPLIFDGVGAGIFGFVTLAGLPANNVSLTLRLRNLDGSTSLDLATTTTNGDGYYQFLDQDPLPPGQYYQVVYYYLSPPDPVPGRLAWWKTKMVTPTVKGQWIHIGNFDIADVVLGNPPDKNSSPLPMTFNWTPRVKSPSDSYLLRIVLYVPPSTYTDKYLSPPSGNVGSISFSADQWPSTLDYGIEYCWFIMIEAPDAASGASRYMRHITFLATP